MQSTWSVAWNVQMDIRYVANLIYLTDLMA